MCIISSTLVQFITFMELSLSFFAFIIVDLLVLTAGLTAEYYSFGVLNFGGKGVMSCQFQWSSNILCRCVTYLVLIFFVYTITNVQINYYLFLKFFRKNKKEML